MADIKTLLKKLDDAGVKETKISQGDTERQFFIELFGSESVDKLLEEFIPDKHNSDWDAERQKPAPDPQRLIQSRQAIAFMASGRNGMFRRYKETELSAYVHGIAYINRNRRFLKMTKDLTDEGMKMHS